MVGVHRRVSSTSLSSSLHMKARSAKDSRRWQCTGQTVVVQDESAHRYVAERRRMDRATHEESDPVT